MGASIPGSDFGNAAQIGCRQLPTPLNQKKKKIAARGATKKNNSKTTLRAFLLEPGHTRPRAGARPSQYARLRAAYRSVEARRQWVWFMSLMCRRRPRAAPTTSVTSARPRWPLLLDKEVTTREAVHAGTTLAAFSWPPGGHICATRCRRERAWVLHCGAALARVRFGARCRGQLLRAGQRAAAGRRRPTAKHAAATFKRDMPQQRRHCSGAVADEQRARSPLSNALTSWLPRSRRRSSRSCAHGRELRLVQLAAAQQRHARAERRQPRRAVQRAAAWRAQRRRQGARWRLRGRRPHRQHRGGQRRRSVPCGGCGSEKAASLRSSTRRGLRARDGGEP